MSDDDPIVSTIKRPGVYALVNSNGLITPVRQSLTPEYLPVRYYERGYVLAYSPSLELVRVDGRSQHEVWITRDERSFLVVRMTTEHLMACYMMLERRLLAEQHRPPPKHRSLVAARKRTHDAVGLWLQRINRELARRSALDAGKIVDDAVDSLSQVGGDLPQESA